MIVLMKCHAVVIKNNYYGIKKIKSREIRDNHFIVKEFANETKYLAVISQLSPINHLPNMIIIIVTRDSLLSGLARFATQYFSVLVVVANPTELSQNKEVKVQ